MEYGEKRIYNDEFEGRDNVIMWDVLKIENEQTIKITFMSKHSKNRQGIRLGIDTGEGYVEVNEVKSKSIELWEDNAPREFLCKCVSSEGLLSVYNLWDKGKGRQSQLLTSGMIVEQKDNILIYHCNDYGYETNFDKLVFSIEKL